MEAWAVALSVAVTTSTSWAVAMASEASDMVGATHHAMKRMGSLASIVIFLYESNIWFHEWIC